MSVTDQVTKTIFTSPYQGHDILTTVVKELLHTGRRTHTVVSFGFAECVPLAAYQDAGLEIVKIVGDGLAEIPTLALLPAENDNTQLPLVHPIFIVGMACRAPDVDNAD